jgi:hypothetical protein
MGGKRALLWGWEWKRFLTSFEKQLTSVGERGGRSEVRIK